MPVWTLIVWVILGAVTGVFASKILGEKSTLGRVIEIIVGIIGAVAAGYGLSLLGISGNGGIIATVIVAVGVALALIWILRKLKGSAA